jgi:hypoxanthine-guanine phosphoribosyltransferase
VDTTKLIENYGYWIGNIIREKYLRVWGNKFPHIILTVNGETGKLFAQLVRGSLHLHACQIIPIFRSVLNETQEPPEDVNLALKKCKDKELRVMLVDDGINTGGTIRKLNRFIQKQGISASGVLVLDNRLSNAELEKLGINMNNFLAIYTWPSRPIEMDYISK